MRSSLFAVWALGSALVTPFLGGCGLVSSDITDFDLFIKDKQFTVDTEQWELSDVPAYTMIDCSQSAGICAAAAEQACAEGQCFGRCDVATDTCELQVVVALWQMVDVKTENSELNTIDDQPVIDVTIDAIDYEVNENTLTIDTPEFTVYVAPSTIMSPGDPEAEAIGTIPGISSRTMIGLTSIELTDDGKATLKTYMDDFMTPFNIIVGAELIVGMGDPVPSGSMTANVQVRAHAGL